MKKLWLIILLTVIAGCLVGCQGSTVDDSSSTPSSTGPEALGTPTLVYSYNVTHRGTADPNEDIDAPAPFYPNVETVDRNLFFLDLNYEPGPWELEFDFFGKTVTADRVRTLAAFPQYPKDFGPYSIYTYQGELINHTRERCTVHIRHATNRPIYISGNHKTFFKELDFEDRDSIVAFATDILKQYASFDGYTLFVYEEGYGNDAGLVVEYNLTVGGQKTNCYVKMKIEYKGEDYEITLTNDIEDQFKPYADAKVDASRLDKIAKDTVDYYYLSMGSFTMDYDAPYQLMVIDGKLCAYMNILPKNARRTEGTGGITPRYMNMLIEVASIEYVKDPSQAVR